MSWCSDAPEDEAISLFAGLLANPDMRLSLYIKLYISSGRLYHYRVSFVLDVIHHS